MFIFYALHGALLEILIYEALTLADSQHYGSLHECHLHWWNVSFGAEAVSSCDDIFVIDQRAATPR
jgi:hypothetical protein